MVHITQAFPTQGKMRIYATHFNDYLSYFCIRISLYLVLHNTSEYDEHVTEYWLTRNWTPQVTTDQTIKLISIHLR